MHVDCKIFSQWDRQIGRCHPGQTNALTFLDVTSSHAAFWWFHLLSHNFHSWWMKRFFKVSKTTKPHFSKIAHSVSSLQFSQPEFFAFWNNRDTECKHVNSIKHTEVKFGFSATSLLISLFQIVLQLLVAIADGVEERVVTVRCALLPLLLIRLWYFCYATTIATCATLCSHFFRYSSCAATRFTTPPLFVLLLHLLRYSKLSRL